MREKGSLEQRRIKKMLSMMREQSLFLALLLVMFFTLFIGFCAYATNATKEINALHQQLISIQNDVNKIEWEVVK